jgi:hypothetical protein
MARVAAVVVCVAAFYGVFAAERVDQNGALWFAHLGRQFVTASNRSRVITRKLRWQEPIGYDGQYYFFLAADPVQARYYMPRRAGYIYSRALYPAVARALSLGSVRAIPYAMLLINLVAVVVATLSVALWLRARRAVVWPAAAFGLFPGLVFCAFSDLTEPLAFALVSLAALAFDARRNSRLVLSAALLALASLTRETVIPFALAGAAALAYADSGGAHGWRSWRAWRRAVIFAAATCGPLLLWRQLIALYVHEPTQERSGTRWEIPFHGIWSYWPFHPKDWLVVLAVIVPALLATVGAAVLVKQRRARLAATLLLANIALYIVFLPSSVDVDYRAAGRAAIGVILAAIYCVPALRTIPRSRIPVAIGGFTWSIAWFLLVAAHYAIPGMKLITT